MSRELFIQFKYLFLITLRYIMTENLETENSENLSKQLKIYIFIICIFINITMIFHNLYHNIYLYFL